jgi:alkyl sulfatase BDS1-like metallo-beta-lactamase superfamily hydrolase
VAKASYAKGEYRWVATLLDNLVFAEPENKEARQLLADTYSQLGYQAESGPWRNFYLTGAQDLLKKNVPYTSKLINDGVLSQMDMGTLLDRLGIAVRTGHHCAQPLMQRLGIEGTVRASFGLYNTKEEIDVLVAGIERVSRMF